MAFDVVLELVASGRRTGRCSAAPSRRSDPYHQRPHRLSLITSRECQAVPRTARWSACSDGKDVISQYRVSVGKTASSQGRDSSSWPPWPSSDSDNTFMRITSVAVKDRYAPAM